jgi:hypothetical protein
MSETIDISGSGVLFFIFSNIVIIIDFNKINKIIATIIVLITVLILYSLKFVILFFVKEYSHLSG